MSKIQFCENNFVHGTEEVVDKLRQNHPNATIEVESCLGYCGDCAIGPYALVDGEMVQADFADDLYESIVELIDD